MFMHFYQQKLGKYLSMDSNSVSQSRWTSKMLDGAKFVNAVD